MAETVIAASLKLDSGQASSSVKSFKQLLKEANNELIVIQDKFGAASKEALAAAKVVAKLKDQIQEAKEVADLFDPGKKFLVFSNAVRASTGGITALTGAMALFGSESEDVQKALLKVQGALALTEGVNTLADAAKDFERLKAVAVDAFKSIKSAIGASGIGLFVVALGLIVAYWDDIKKSVGLATAEQLRSLEVATAQYNKEKERLEVLQSQENVLRQQGVSEQHILDLEIQQLENTIKAGEKQLGIQKKLNEQSVKGASNLSSFLQSILPSSAGQGIFAYLTTDALIEGEKTIKASKQELDKLKDQRAQHQLEEIKIINDFNQKVLQLNHDAAEAGITDQYVLNKRKAQDAFEAAKAQAAVEYTNVEQRNTVIAGLQAKFNAEQTAAAKAHQRQLQDDLRKIAFDGFTANIQDQTVLGILQTKFQLDNDIRQTNLEISNKKDRDEKIAALTAAAELKIQAIRNKFTVETFQKLQKARLEQQQTEEDADLAALNDFQDKRQQAQINGELQSKEIDDLRLDAAGQAAAAQLKQLSDFYTQRYALVKGNAQAEAKLNAEFERQKTLITKMQNEARLKLVSQVLGNAAALFEKNTIAYKAFAISQTIIDTYASAVSSYRSLAGIPVVGPALGFAAAAVAVASGLANVQRILAVDTSGTDTSAPSGGGGGVSAPLTQQPQVGNTQLPQSQLNQINNAANPVRAFVVESDVTNNQERVKRLNRAARLGG